MATDAAVIYWGAVGAGLSGGTLLGATSGIEAAEGGEVLATRGLGGVGEFSSTTNAAGGEVFTSAGNIVQSDFEGIVNSGLYKGDVNILTGVPRIADGRDDSRCRILCGRRGSLWPSSRSQHL